MFHHLAYFREAVLGVEENSEMKIKVDVASD